ncbi:MAG: D-2-hydroxyacid dehydrogenase [Hyphomicrobium sp.]|nr:D-2-hydroxyacid dehydrogenase [Hyphomicrobium sp.]
MSNKLQALLYLSNPKPYLERLAADGLNERVDFKVIAAGEQATDDDLAKAEILFAPGVPPGTLSKMPRLKIIQSLTAGVDHWLARKDLKPEHTLIAARGTHRIQVPENILGALFHITKRYHQIALNQAERRWNRSVSDTLAGKTLGILGLGAIGQQLAMKASALEMRVIGTKRTPEPVVGVDKVYGFNETDKVLAESDYVVVLLPVTPLTENFLNTTQIAKMKPSAWLINFARGAIIVDDDLIAAVKAKTIAGAVLDVFRTEPLPPEHPFWKTPGISVLPHIGGYHPQRDSWVAELLADNIRRHLDSQPLREVVDRERGY